ncbi:hypothetical protein [Chitinophaga sp. sic0106]|uniref:hypothetical protein n=1 Tax=Chitinophaga sp. sic0106 TaxID=2854785 RepID=UPI001C450B32|nr:hypothetical protein [Chitinophaga sp. sic0106]MBV7534071.1 hypothetical protein [Chitinophaga sp. sic0106]
MSNRHDKVTQQKIYMPRKSKEEELRDWLREMKPFLIEVNMIAYISHAVLLAVDYNDAVRKMEAQYPGVDTRIINQLTTVVI